MEKARWEMGSGAMGGRGAQVITDDYLYVVKLKISKNMKAKIEAS